MPIPQAQEPGFIDPRPQRTELRVVEALPDHRLEDEARQQENRRLPLAMRDHAFSEQGLDALRAASKTIPPIIARLKTNPCRVVDL